MGIITKQNLIFFLLKMTKNIGQDSISIELDQSNESMSWLQWILSQNDGKSF